MPVFIWCDGWDDGEEEMSDEVVINIVWAVVFIIFMYGIYRLATEKEPE